MTPQKRPCGTRRLTPRQMQKDRDSHWLASLPWLEPVPMTVERRKAEVEEIILEIGADPWASPERKRRSAWLAKSRRTT